MRGSSYNNPAICVANIEASSARDRMPTIRCLKINSVVPLIAEDGIRRKQNKEWSERGCVFIVATALLLYFTN